MDENNSAFNKDALCQILDRINFWIENCDTKTSIAISAIGIIFAVLLSKDYAVKFKAIIGYMVNNINFFSFLYLTFTVISISIISLGCYCLFRVLVSRTDINLYKEAGIQLVSSIFFSGVANSKSYKDYRKKLENFSENDLRNDLISQIYICSKICDKKFKNYKTGITLVFIGFVFFLCLIVIGLIII